MGVARFCFLFYVVEVVEHQQRMGERFCSNGGQRVVVQRINQRMDVVTTLHGAQQLNGFFRCNQRRGGFTFYDSGQEAGFYIGGFINARRNTVGQQI